MFYYFIMGWRDREWPLSRLSQGLFGPWAGRLPAPACVRVTEYACIIMLCAWNAHPPGSAPTAAASAWGWGTKVCPHSFCHRGACCPEPLRVDLGPEPKAIWEPLRYWCIWSLQWFRRQVGLLDILHEKPVGCLPALARSPQAAGKWPLVLSDGIAADFNLVQSNQISCREGGSWVAGRERGSSGVQRAALRFAEGLARCWEWKKKSSLPRTFLKGTSLATGCLEAGHHHQVVNQADGHKASISRVDSEWKLFRVI